MEVPKISISGFYGPLHIENSAAVKNMAEIFSSYKTMEDVFVLFRWVRNFQCKYLNPPSGYIGAIFSAGPETATYLVFVSENETTDGIPEMYVYANKRQCLNTCAAELLDWITHGHSLWQLIQPQLPESVLPALN